MRFPRATRPDPADGDAALADVCRLIGCRRAEAVTFAADLVMWLDEDTRPAGDPAVNRAATLVGARFERGRVYVGSVVYTGGADLHLAIRDANMATAASRSRSGRSSGGRSAATGGGAAATSYRSNAN